MKNKNYYSDKIQILNRKILELEVRKEKFSREHIETFFPNLESGTRVKIKFANHKLMGTINFARLDRDNPYQVMVNVSIHKDKINVTIDRKDIIKIYGIKNET